MKYIYHVTHFINLEKILQSGAVLCKNLLNAEISDHVSIAYEGIQKHRHRTIVPISPGGNLHDYVPFHFAPRSPMLYTILMGNVESFQEGQDTLIYLVVKIQDIVSSHLEFVYCDGHPIMAFSKFFSDLSMLKTVIDWQLMKARYWHNTDDDSDRKRRRQAEFLVYQKLPVELINRIVVLK